MPFFTPSASPYVPGYAREPHFDAQQDFGFIGDLISVGEITAAGTSVVMTASSPTLTLTNKAPFTSTAVDAGKTIIVEGAGASGGPLRTTILSVTSSSVATLNTNASTTVTASTTVEINVSFGTMNTIAGPIAAMTTMINTTLATFPGARIKFGPSATNAYWFEGPVVFNGPVQVEGIGGGHVADSGNYSRIGGTRLAWGATTTDGGTAFGAFFTFVPSGVQALKRCAMRHLWLDCRNNNQNQALIGLKTSSVHGFMSEDFYIMDSKAKDLWCDIGTTPIGDAKDNTRFTFRDLCIRALDNPTIVANAPMTTPILMTSGVVLTTTPQTLTVAANTLPNVSSGYFWTATTMGSPVLVRYTSGGGSTSLGGCTIASELVVHTPTTVNGGNVVEACPSNSCGLFLNGGSAANTCCGVFDMFEIQQPTGGTWGPAAIEHWNSDSVEFRQTLINGGNVATTNAINRITKPGVRFGGSIVSATLAARNNRYYSGDPGVGGVSHMGLNNASVRLLSMAGPNGWFGMQLGNGAPLPVIEGNSHFDWDANGAFRPGYRVAGPVTGQAIAAATLTQINGSIIPVPPQGFQIGAIYKWTIIGQGGAAGTTAGHLFHVRIGTAGTTGDTARATFTCQTTPTAVVSDFVITIHFCVRTLGAAATAVATCNISNAGAAGTNVGFIGALQQTLPGTMATFDSTVAQQFMTLSIQTAAAKTATINQVFFEVLNPGNNT